MNVIVILICVFAPLGILWLTYKSVLLRKVGSIIIAYVIGCTLGLTGLIPDTEEMHAVQTTIASVAIPLAIPLLLLSADLKAWARLAPAFIKSTIFGLLGCAIAITIGFMVYGKSNPSLFARVGGMLTGLYTGGNANLASLKIALDVDDATYILTSAYSTVLSAVYLFFVIIFGKRLLRLFMPDFKDDKTIEDDTIKVENHEDELFLGLFRKDNLKHLGMSILLAIGIIAVGAGIAYLFPKDSFQSVFILGISLLSILASLNKRVRSLKRTFEAGTFFILIFSIAVASQVSLKTLTDVNPDIFLFITIATLGSLFFHVLLSALFRIDTDTTLTTSISLICSPPFAPVMGSALKNKAVIGPGIAVGLFGYAIGTYMGFGLAKLLLSSTLNDDPVLAVETEYIPKAPDYDDATMWITADGDSLGTGADIFYVVSTWEEDWTTEDGRICHYADVWNPQHRKHMGSKEIDKVAAYMSPGNRFYAPYYRHTTIEAFMTQNEDTIYHRTRLAMNDVCTAFDHFQAHRDKTRPLIIAGFSQGGLAVVELLKHMDDETYSQLAAAYVLGYKVTPEDTLQTNHIKAAQGETDTGVTICYNTVKDLKYIQPVIAATCMGINPVNWHTDATPATLHDTITVTLSPEYHVLVVSGYSGSEYAPYRNFINVGDIHSCEPWLYSECLQQNIAVRTREQRKKQ